MNLTTSPMDRRTEDTSFSKFWESHRIKRFVDSAVLVDFGCDIHEVGSFAMPEKFAPASKVG